MDQHWELFLRIVIGTILGGVIGYERDVHRRPGGPPDARDRSARGLHLHGGVNVVRPLSELRQRRPRRGRSLPHRRLGRVRHWFLGGRRDTPHRHLGAGVDHHPPACGSSLRSACVLGPQCTLRAFSSPLSGSPLSPSLKRLEDKEDSVGRRRISLVMATPTPPVATIVSQLEQLGAVTQAEYEKELEAGRTSVIFDARVPARLDYERLLATLEGEPGVRRVRIERVA
jgi:putative Mg2+ transporter-C (MgtC) family protein